MNDIEIIVENNQKKALQVIEKNGVREVWESFVNHGGFFAAENIDISVSKKAQI